MGDAEGIGLKTELQQASIAVIGPSGIGDGQVREVY